MSKYRFNKSHIYIDETDIEDSIECVQFADSSRLSAIVFEGLKR